MEEKIKEAKFREYINKSFDDFCERFNKSCLSENTYPTIYSKLDYVTLYKMFNPKFLSEIDLEDAQPIFQEMANRICAKLKVKPLKIELQLKDEDRAGTYLPLDSKAIIFVGEYFENITKNNEGIRNFMVLKTLFHECYHHKQKHTAYETFNNKEVSAYDKICAIGLFLMAYYDETELYFREHSEEYSCDLLNEYRSYLHGLNYLPHEIDASTKTLGFLKALNEKQLVEDHHYKCYLNAELTSFKACRLEYFYDYAPLFYQREGIGSINCYLNFLIDEKLKLIKTNSVLTDDNWQKYYEQMEKLGNKFKQELNQMEETQAL